MVIENLATDGIGTVSTGDRSTVFFKKLLADVDEDQLKRYEVNKEEYLCMFNERSDGGIISKELFKKFLEKHPQKARLCQEHHIDPEDDNIDLA